MHTQRVHLEAVSLLAHLPLQLELALQGTVDDYAQTALSVG